jgi:hypothetical protein
LRRALFEVVADREDLAFVAVDIGRVAIRRGDDLAVLDEQTHRFLRSAGPRRDGSRAYE